MLRLTGATTIAMHVLALGAHPDDIEIGCGGTLMRLASEGKIATVTWVVMSGDGPRNAEARVGAGAVLRDVPRVDVQVHELRDGYFPAQYGMLKDVVESLAHLNPDVIVTPRRGDAHQDHRLLSEVAATVFRDHLILEYEIPKYDGDLSLSNVYVDLPAPVAERKTEILMEAFPSQRDRHWYSAETFLSLMRLRGVECRAAAGFAEAFVCRKMII